MGRKGAESTRRDPGRGLAARCATDRTRSTIHLSVTTHLPPRNPQAMQGHSDVNQIALSSPYTVRFTNGSGNGAAGVIFEEGDGRDMWMERYMKCKMIQRSWAGNNPHRRIHRIKVNEKVGIIMKTTGIGGLMVRDLETDKVLWELPRRYVRGFAHLEYGKGYMIFDRGDGSKEVWRCTAYIDTDSGTDPAPPVLTTSFPDDRQRYVADCVNGLTSTISLTATQ
ncbi:hypothetical protein BDZ97DRAFT_1918628 [Flammula alnicola]|nr:hypothetical protein BDZ97DRAFT_1918625 [Flammula alnicola]KAF8964928.1 hypothetical protein BDZ97DRAFT_1918628 [Flammula alnicola]